MFDSRPEPTHACADWRAALTYGDLVIFRFPVADEDGADKPKKRPCLVLETVEIAGMRYAVLAFGTSAETAANRGYDTTVEVTDELVAAGLHRRTRFVAARRVLVPLTHHDFCLGKVNGSPVIGRLSGSAHARMNAVRARIAAEADMAADRRTAARRKRRKPRNPHRPVVVEFRRPKQLKLPLGTPRMSR